MSRIKRHPFASVIAAIALIAMISVIAFAAYLASASTSQQQERVGAPATRNKQ